MDDELGRIFIIVTKNNRPYFASEMASAHKSDRTLSGVWERRRTRLSMTSLSNNSLRTSSASNEFSITLFSLRYIPNFAISMSAGTVD